MGNVSPDGKTLWLSGRYDDVVYAIDTTTGTVKSIPVGMEPHGLTIWPQPGHYSLGHTGNSLRGTGQRSVSGNRKKGIQGFASIRDEEANGRNGSSMPFAERSQLRFT